MYVPEKNLKNKKSLALRIVSWNVRIIHTGLSDNHHQIDVARKTAVINRELYRLNIDIAALQQTRLSDTGSLREKNYTFFWQGRAEETRKHDMVLVSQLETPYFI